MQELTLMSHEGPDSLSIWTVWLVSSLLVYSIVIGYYRIYWKLEKALIKLRLNAGWDRDLSIWTYFLRNIAIYINYGDNTIHYENTPIQIYWKFCNQKRKIFR